MTFLEVLTIASGHIMNLKNSTMGVVDIAKPTSLQYAKHLAKVVSKLSPLVGNMIEFNLCEELNKIDWKNEGIWIRQDPGFPDTLFKGNIKPAPGIEIKTWFPLATEITARFKDSIKFFEQDQTNVALVAWLPEFIIYGKPKLIDIWIGSAKSLAQARDLHYHNPPDYLVFEPEDTQNRTSNLQQTNTNGYKFQGKKEDLTDLEAYISGWGENPKVYEPSVEYQRKVKDLMGRHSYRLDTNFAKMDRIRHVDLETFKTRVLNTNLFGHDIKTWAKLIGDEEKDIVQLIEELIQAANQKI